MDVDGVLSRIGEFGLYQKILFVLTGLAWVPCALQTMLIVFTSVLPEWRCVDPDDAECLAATNLCDLDRSQWYFPRNADGGFTSLAAEWGLTCADSFRVGLLGSIFFSGYLVGAGIFGMLSDRIGRRKSFFLGLLIIEVSSIMSAFVTDYYSYAALRFVAGASTGGLSLVSFCLATELLGPKFRSLIGTLFNIFYAVAIMALSPLAFYFPSWRALTLVTAVPPIILFLSWNWLPESPRWHLVKGRTDVARDILAVVARTNGTTMPEEGLMPPKSIAQGSLWALFKSGSVRNMTLYMLLNWFAGSFTYYGLSFSSGSLGGSLFWNNFVGGLVEIPSYIVCAILLDRVGRRKTLLWSMLLAGFSCLSVVFLQEGSVLTLAIVMTGKFGISAAYAIVYIYAAEIFPTVVRNAAVGLCSQAARVGGILAPGVISLASISFSLPLVIFGSAALLAGVAAAKLPETLNKPLPDTLPESPRASATPLLGPMTSRFDSSAVEESNEVSKDV